MPGVEGSVFLLCVTEDGSFDSLTLAQDDRWGGAVRSLGRRLPRRFAPRNDSVLWINRYPMLPGPSLPQA